MPLVMSEEQRQFASQRHNMIYSFLYQHGRSVEDYYDIAVFGFLKAVIRYLRDPHLQLYAFSTIAWQAMEQSIHTYHRAEARRKRAEALYCAEHHPAACDPFSEFETALLLRDLASRTTDLQYRLAEMRLQGYSIAETAKAYGMSSRQVSRLLKEMYSVYLRLYVHSETEAMINEK